MLCEVRIVVIVCLLVCVCVLLLFCVFVLFLLLFCFCFVCCCCFGAVVGGGLFFNFLWTVLWRHSIVKIKSV